MNLILVAFFYLKEGQVKVLTEIKLIGIWIGIPWILKISGDLQHAGTDDVGDGLILKLVYLPF